MTDQPNWRLKPARDQGLATGQRLRSQAREPGLVGLMAHWTWQQLVRCYLRPMHRLQVTGRENLPAQPPYVLVANHSSHLDALTLLAALPSRQAHLAYSLAAGDHFFTSAPAAAFAAYAVNALPVWRTRTTRHELEALRERLEADGLIYILFPEGTRSRDGAMGRFRGGIGALVAGSQVPVVPCFLEGAHAAWPPHQRWPRPGRLRLSIGPPVHFADLPNAASGWKAAADRCETAVRAMAQGGDRTHPTAG